MRAEIMPFGGLQLITMLLRGVGWLVLVPGLLLALFNGPDSFTQIVSCCCAVVFGLIFVALAELLQMLSAVAKNIESIPQLVEYAKETNSFFVRVAAKANQQAAPPAA